MGERKTLLDTPWGHKIEDEFVQNGFGDLVATSRAYLEPDCDELRQYALRVYGQSHQHNENVEGGYHAPSRRPDPTGAGNPASLGNSKAAYALYSIVDGVDAEVAETVQRQWEGRAADNFAEYMAELKAVTRQEAERLVNIGDVLYEFALQIEQHQIATEDSYAGAITFYKTVKQASEWVQDPGTWVKTVGVYYAIGKAIWDQHKKAAEQFEANAQHVNLLADLVLGLRTPDVESRHSTAGLEEKKYSKEADDWDLKEPYE